MSDLQIITNNVPRFTVDGYELTESERKEFDYYKDPEDLDDATFFRYKGNVYDLGEAMRLKHTPPGVFEGWDGYYVESIFSGVLVKFVDDGEQVIVGHYYS